MHSRIYSLSRGVKKHLTTVLIAASVSLLCGGTGAFAVGQISGSLIKPGTVGEGKLITPLQQKLDRLDTVASIESLNGLEKRWEEDIQAARERIEADVEREYVRKDPAP